MKAFITKHKTITTPEKGEDPQNTLNQTAKTRQAPKWSQSTTRL
jgi:hypothetical protein